MPRPGRGALHADWKTAFLPAVSLLEIIVRGSIVYFSLFALLRVVLKRQSGSVGITDLLLIVLIADAAQNAMAAEYRSVTAGLVLVATLVFWSYALDWLAYHFRPLRALVSPPPLLLIKGGHMLRRNMRQELLTVEDLLGELRERGVDGVGTVKAAYMEGDGHISVVQQNGQHHEPAREGQGS
jgi:uncharacterized membrane protein YcaP (DUF421 family)